jgi:putative oxidoreductase
MIHVTLPTIASDISLLIVRVVIGFSFIVASHNKSKNIRKFANKNGLPLTVAFLVMVAEMAAGVALILGLLSQLAALVIMSLMLGTMRLHIFKWKSPYWAARGGWEYDLMLFTLAFVIVVHGGGKLVILN